MTNSDIQGVSQAVLVQQGFQLADEIRQKCSDLTAMLIRDSGFADKFFTAMIRKMQADKGPSW